MNNAAVDQTLENLVEIEYSESWAEASAKSVSEKDEPGFC